MAAPRPREAPVTRAVLPARLEVMLLLGERPCRDELENTMSTTQGHRMTSYRTPDRMYRMATKNLDAALDEVDPHAGEVDIALLWFTLSMAPAERLAYHDSARKSAL